MKPSRRKEGGRKWEKGREKIRRDINPDPLCEKGRRNWTLVSKITTRFTKISKKNDGGPLSWEG